MKTNISTKGLAFSAMMAAMGNVLSFLSIRITPLVPNIPLGPVSVSLALDLSHLTTFIAAFFGGPIIGAFTGLLGGLVGAFEFGFSQGNFITGFGLPIGKALTGFVAGYVLKKIYRNGNSLKLIISTVISYIPEALFTAVIFILLFPVFLGIPRAISNLIAIQILVKAFVEMIILGVVLNMILGNQSFSSYASANFTRATILSE
jgi:LytS/YehU family sensor histidine kinase